jgi:toxin FitB
MFLTDTNVISEFRKEERADDGVRAFFANYEDRDIHLSVVTVAELHQGVHALRRRGDEIQAKNIENWVERILRQYAKNILIVDKAVGEIWARLRVPHREPALDKLIAATALAHGLTVVTRNVRDFEITGVPILNPFK